MEVKWCDHDPIGSRDKGEPRGSLVIRLSQEGVASGYGLAFNVPAIRIEQIVRCWRFVLSFFCHILFAYGGRGVNWA